MSNESFEMRRELDAALPKPRDFSASLRVLRRGTSGALLVQVGGAGLSLIVNVVLARLVGKTEYGVYTLVFSWMSVLSVFALLGQSSSVVRFVPTYIHRQEWGTLRGLRRGASAIVLLASIVIMLIGAFIVFALRRRLGSNLELTLLVGFLLLPLVTQLGLNGAFFRGFKRAVRSGAYDNVVRPLVLVGLVLVLVLALGWRLTAPGVMAASVVATLVTLVGSEWRLTRVWPAAARGAQPSYDVPAWFKLGRQLFFLAAMGIANNRADVLILGALAGAVVVGPYYAAVRLAALAVYGLSAVNTILAPMIAESYVAGEHDKMAKMVHHAAKLTFVVTMAVALPLAIAGHWILGLFGKGFAEAAYVPLLIILLGQCINATAGPVGFLMTMTRYEREAPWFTGGAALLNVLLSLALIPPFGLIGAAIATAFSTIAWNLTALVFVRRKLGVNPTILPMASR
ncbi:MAG TPA: oligosaccharide flippase family protein [Rhodanobacteraceae bacterium]